MSTTVASMLSRQKLVGSRVKAVEAKKVLLGRTTYVDDLQLPRMMYLSFVRSAVPHGKITKIDISNVSRNGEIKSVTTGKGIVSEIKPFPIFASPKGLTPIRIYPIAIAKTRYAGEIVACLVSRNRYTAEDVSELVDVDYEPLDPILDAEKANDNPPIIDGWDSNLAITTRVQGGDPRGAFSKADHVFKEKFKVQRQYGAPMEPRSVVADYDESTGRLTVWSSTQWPHIVRTVLSQMLGTPEHLIRVIAPDVGGGFGNKQDVYPEEILVAYHAIKLRRPIKWTATRSEDILSTVHGRDQTHHVEVATGKDGTVLGLKDRIVADLGAFHIMSLGPQLVSLGALPGPYRIKNWDIFLECYVTNKTPVGAYRGFGQSEANFVIERSMDFVASELKLDPVRVREMNLIRPNEFPYETPIGGVYDSGNYVECLRKALAFSNFEEFRKQNALSNRQRGIGLSIGFEGSGVGPSKQMGIDGFQIYSGFDSATVKIDRSGKVTILTGLSPHGQGVETTLSQVCADELGLPIEDIVVLHGDTESSPYGFGTWGSRSAVIGSAAVKKSIDKIKDKGAAIAAHVLKVSKNEIEYSDGSFFAKGKKEISIADVAKIAHDAHNLPPGIEPGFEATSFHDPVGVAYPYAVHIPIIEIDVETGQLRLIKYFIVHDCGVMINPTIVEGQLHGGVAQGIAASLLEELAYDSDGQLLSSTFIDYLLPTASDIPEMEIEHMVTPTLPSINPLGVKGMGEGGTIAPPAAIASAIDNALQSYGVRITATPVTPEKLLQLVSAGKKR